MNLTATRLPYQQTGHFSPIMTDYLDGSAFLRPFYEHPANLDGARAAVEARKRFATDRNLLADELHKQYQRVQAVPAVQESINRLRQANCFTITTAHQPAIFTGTLYFIYKIFHAIALGKQLEKAMPDCQFVPVYFMGSEDADLEELGKIFLDGQEIRWDTKQQGAVGRMKPKGLEKIIQRIEGEFGVQPFGKELVALFREAYLDSENIQEGTFRLINALFGQYGLLVLIPDNPAFKKALLPIFEDDLFNKQPAKLLAEPIRKLSTLYKVQAQPREINLFYLQDNLRGRIEEKDGVFMVHDSDLRFSAEAMRKELNDHPERFSPNVILRGLMQETLLPNIAFIGGGGEMAYWLELKILFENYRVPYPMLVLRNSFLIVEKKWSDKMARASLALTDIFHSEADLINGLVKRESTQQLDLQTEIDNARQYYGHLKSISGGIDPTLTQHVEALETRALKPIRELEKKMLKAEKRKFEEQHRQIALIRMALFPGDGLQERVQNFIPYYARWGKAFLEAIGQHSLGLEQQFVILQEK